MILIFHILAATSSLAYTAWVFIKPTQSGLVTAYVLVALTVISGCALLVLNPAHLTQTCETGLVYLAIVTVGIFAARHKLAKT